MATDPSKEMPSSSVSSPSGPSVPEGGGEPSDRFDRPEPAERTSARTVLLWQYFLFPLLIVAAAVGVFLAFGLIAGDQPTPLELLDDMATGGENQKDQAAQQLGILIGRERMRVDAERDPSAGRPPFYADAAFRTGLRRVLDAVLHERDADVRAQAVVLMVGRTQDVDSLDTLRRILYPGEKDPHVAPRTRKAAAMAVWYLDAPASLELLAQMTRDDDAEVRAVAELALARLGDEEGPGGGALHGDPRVVELLRAGLEDADGGVRLDAAVGLAVHGDDTGAGFVLRSLDRSDLTSAGIEDPDMQRAALLNGIKAARLIGTETLRAAVGRLADDSREQDEVVRQMAREALSRWKEQR